MKNKSNKKQYWLAVLIISVGVAILIHFAELIALTERFENHNIFPDIKFVDVANEIFISFLSLIILFVLVTFIFKFNDPKQKVSVFKVILAFLVTLTASTILSNAFHFLHFKFHLPAVQATMHHYLHPIRDVIISFVVTGSCFIIYLIRRQQSVIVENQQLKYENISCRHEALKNQINPHMLFNSLNTLRSLTREEPEKALDYIQELSNVLRYMLQENESKTVTLAEELEFAEAYIYLLKMRYEDNLIFDIDIDKSFLPYLTAPMSLQLLIENAVKHNEISTKKPLRITLKTDENETLTICNPVQPKLTNSTGMGLGLKNLSKRYQLIFNKKEININNEDSIFCVILPLIKPTAYHESIDY